MLEGLFVILDLDVFVEQNETDGVLSAVHLLLDLEQLVFDKDTQDLLLPESDLLDILPVGKDCAVYARYERVFRIAGQREAVGLFSVVDVNLGFLA